MIANLPLRDSPDCKIAVLTELLQKASNLVNPNSGLANDFLNQYNELLLLVENLPILLPEMMDELLAWEPKSYEAYFQASSLPGGSVAIDIYRSLDLAFQNKFEAQIVKIDKLARKAVALICEQRRCVKEIQPEDVEVVCAKISIQLRAELDKAADLINHGLGASLETPQGMADRLMRI